MKNKPIIICSSCYYKFIPCKKVIACPNCGSHHIRASKITRNTAYDAVRFGYQYRIRYEKTFKTKPNCDVRYLLHEIDPALIKIGVYVVEWLLCNLAYDLIKKYVKIYVNKNIEKNKALVILTKDANVRVFINYLKDYLKNKPHVNLIINKAIHDERFTHYYVRDKLPNILKKYSLIHKKQKDLKKKNPIKKSQNNMRQNIKGKKAAHKQQ